MIDIIIADDQPLARKRLKSILDEIPEANLIAAAKNGKQAIEFIQKNSPDLVLLDIQMPDYDGFEVIEKLSQNKPYIIFTTGHDDYTLKAFEVYAVDYILKPIDKERLKKSIRHFIDNKKAKTEQSFQKLLSEIKKDKKTKFDRLPVKRNSGYHFLNYKKISHIEADGKYTYIHSKEGQKFHSDFSLKELEEKLSGEGFFRVHRSVLINLQAIKKIDPSFKGKHIIKTVSGAKLEVARRRFSELKNILGIN